MLKKLNDASYHYNVWKESKDGKKSIIMFSCTVPNDVWHFEIVPFGGWIPMSYKLWGFVLCVLIASLITAVYWQNKTKRLKEEMYAREIAESAKKVQEAGKYTIGVDIDQSGDSTTVITSALKDVKGATMEVLKAYKDDKFQSGKTITLKNSGEIVYLGAFKNFSKVDYEAADKKIKDGSVDLKSYNDINEKTGNPSKIAFENVTVNFE